MKKAIIALAILVAAGTTTTTFAEATQGKKSHHKTAKAKVYTCPMHPEVTSNKPGKCPKCGMKLELAKTDKKQ